MIASLAVWVERDPGAGRVLVAVGPAHSLALSEVGRLGRMDARRADSPDLWAILATDDPGEVKDLCELAATCPHCTSLLESADECPYCRGPVLPVTHRLFLWRGQEVEHPWEELLCDYPGVDAARAAHTYPPWLPLTAVVLALDPEGEHLLLGPRGIGRLVDEAHAACEAAGIQFVGPGEALEVT